MPVVRGCGRDDGDCPCDGRGADPGWPQALLLLERAWTLEKRPGESTEASIRADENRLKPRLQRNRLLWRKQKTRRGWMMPHRVGDELSFELRTLTVRLVTRLGEFFFLLDDDSRGDHQHQAGRVASNRNVAEQSAQVRDLAEDWHATF